MMNSKDSFAILVCLLLLFSGKAAFATKPVGPETTAPDATTGAGAFYNHGQSTAPTPFTAGVKTLYTLWPEASALLCVNKVAAVTPPRPAAEAAKQAAASLPPVPMVTNHKVERFVKFFESDGRWYFKKWLERTGAYEKRIKRVLREEGLPEGLFYIALIESGLSPTTRSRADAVGMWQFIKPTAKRYGLRVDWWIDERRDPEKSTRAAGRFFKRLYTRYGSWYMAMAGYNGGEGRIRRSIKKHGTSDYWALSQNRRALRRETRNYVPKYLAALKIAHNPEGHGFTNLDYKKSVEYDTARISTQTDLRVIARAAGVSVWTIKRLNHELLRMYTPPDYPEYEIKLPPGTAERFWANFTRIPPSGRVSFIEHILQPGETVSTLAYRYGTPVKPILALNRLTNPRRIRAGTVIMVPVRSNYIKTKGKGRT